MQDINKILDTNIYGRFSSQLIRLMRGTFDSKEG